MVVGRKVKILVGVRRLLVDGNFGTPVFIDMDARVQERKFTFLLWFSGEFDVSVEVVDMRCELIDVSSTYLNQTNGGCGAVARALSSNLSM